MFTVFGMPILFVVAGVAELTEFTTLDGEASANNRKSKLIFFYEWDIKMKWKGQSYSSLGLCCTRYKYRPLSKIVTLMLCYTQVEPLKRYI